MHAVLAQGANGPTHPELAEIARVSQRAVDGVVSATAKKSKRLMVGGSPARLGPGLGLVLGISVGRESLRAGLLDANGDLFAPDEAPLMANQLALPPRDLLRRIRELAASVLRAGLDDDRLWVGSNRTIMLLGAVVAWPSPVDRDWRPGGQALQHPGWRTPLPGTDQPPTLKSHLANALGEPFDHDRCWAINDVNAHALAVTFAQTRSRASEPAGERWRIVQVVRVGGGLGAATVILAPHDPQRLSFIPSKLIVGTHGFAGELGHLPVDKQTISARNQDNPYKGQLARLEFDRWTCSCGRKHHLEAFASGAALIRRMKNSGIPVPDSSPERLRFIRGVHENPNALQIHALEDIGRLIGQALASPILMLDPHSITFTGSLATEHLVKGVQLEREKWRSVIGDTVRVDHLDDDESAFAGVRGAALAMMRHSVYRSFLDGKSWNGPPAPYGDEDLDRLAVS